MAENNTRLSVVQSPENLERRSFFKRAVWLAAGTALAGGAGAYIWSRQTAENVWTSDLWPALRDNPVTKALKLNVQLNGELPTYNGVSPGPSIFTRAGSSFDVALVNDLPRLDDDCTNDFNQFHGLNTTNLHTHGLHVSPSTDSSGKYDADNVFVSVVPKDQFVPCENVCGSSVEKHFRKHRADYRFELPEGHASGTFWYHAHKHGATQQQVGEGLSGPLIVQDPEGFMPDYIAQADEKIFMIMNAGVMLVNPEGGGVLNPRFAMRPGAVERWRIINAQAAGNAFAYLRTDLRDLEFYQIAFDGLTLPQRIEIDQFSADEPWLNPAALAPGNRMDLMVRVPLDAKPGKLNLGIQRGIADLLNVNGATNSVQIGVDIEGEPTDSLWSDDAALPGSGLVPFGSETLSPRELDFTPRFTIEGEAFDGEVKHTMKLGDAEQWTVLNRTGGVHAFHIHVNPFFITHVNGEELPQDSPLRRWQDTIGLPFQEDGVPGSVGFKTRFERFKGKFVIHCHILRHEDLGMMQTVEVV